MGPGLARPRLHRTTYAPMIFIELTQPSGKILELKIYELEPLFFRQS